MLETLGQQFVNALVIGSTYTLIAIGITLFFGILNLINFAHSEIYMLGAFAGLVAYRIVLHTGIPTTPYILIPLLMFSSMFFCALCGYGIEKIAFKPLRLRKVSLLGLLVTSLAVQIIIRECVMLFFPDGANPQVFPEPFFLKSIAIGSIIIGYIQIFIICSAFLLIYLLHLFITKTKLGHSIRAISEDTEAAEMMGVNIDRTISTTFLIGSALGAVAGVMSGMNYGSIKFDMGFTAGIKGFTSAVLGGLGNVYGAIVGGYTLAFLEVLATTFIPRGSAYKDIFAFIILILVLAFKPAGIITRVSAEKV